MRFHRLSPWMFGFVAVPYGVVSALITTVMPFLFRKTGFELDRIGWFSVITQFPVYMQFLYAPLVDLKFRREFWLVGASLFSAACVVLTTLLPLPKYTNLFPVLVLLANIAITFISSCNGGLLAATPMQGPEKARAASWHSFGNLGGNALASFIFLSVTPKISTFWVCLICLVLIVLPAWFSLLLPAPPVSPSSESKHALRTLGKALKTRLGWSGILLCLTPVGTAALMYAFAAVAKDYTLKNESTVGIFSGVAMIVALALGSMIASKLNHRFPPRKVYLVTGVVSAVISIAMVLAPLRPISYFIGISMYLLVGGVSTASFYPVVFETIGHAGGAFSTYYTLFVSASNGAIAYVTLINGKLHRHHGIRGWFLSDAALNLVGALIWGLLLVTLFRTMHKTSDAKEDAA